MQNTCERCQFSIPFPNKRKFFRMFRSCSTCLSVFISSNIRNLQSNNYNKSISTPISSANRKGNIRRRKIKKVPSAFCYCLGKELPIGNFI